ncbi:hypothetical protein MHYP_G00341370 [Metynnis hypsauchen]
MRAPRSLLCIWCSASSPSQELPQCKRPRAASPLPPNTLRPQRPSSPDFWPVKGAHGGVRCQGITPRWNKNVDLKEGSEREKEEEREKKVVRFQTTPCRAPTRRFQGILSQQCRGAGELARRRGAEAGSDFSRSEERLARLQLPQ